MEKTERLEVLLIYIYQWRIQRGTGGISTSSFKKYKLPKCNSKFPKHPHLPF